MSYCDHLLSVHLSVHTFKQLQTPGPVFFKLHVEPSVEGGLKICTNGHSLLIKMATMPYGVKTLKNLLQNRESFEAKSWYIALGTLGLPSLLYLRHTKYAKGVYSFRPFH